MCVCARVCVREREVDISCHSGRQSIITGEPLAEKAPLPPHTHTHTHTHIQRMAYGGSCPARVVIV